jgi:hypothetical protein
MSILYDVRPRVPVEPDGKNEYRSCPRGVLQRGLRKKDFGGGRELRPGGVLGKNPGRRGVPLYPGVGALIEAWAKDIAKSGDGG